MCRGFDARVLRLLLPRPESWKWRSKLRQPRRQQAAAKARHLRVRLRASLCMPSPRPRKASPTCTIARRFASFVAPDLFGCPGAEFTRSAGLSCIALAMSALEIREAQFLQRLMERPSSECGARSPQSLDDPVDCFDEFFVQGHLYRLHAPPLHSAP